MISNPRIVAGTVTATARNTIKAVLIKLIEEGYGQELRREKNQLSPFLTELTTYNLIGFQFS